ncbi:MAG: hypothetical protein COW54_04800 [Rhodobacteraceae bacterium CG17_big_fil_post_rev_8_21_14_2_50_63_15]|nr:hypothetical protein [Roseovarius sp.]PIV79341.1 MAG: hypothetical protein COW54_04800 [Rhodobacteraceae bacterium CG17_big_fil_post_rev_8_21_14_2_50_63_15]
MQTDDEALMALADGEITGPQADLLHARIAADAATEARYRMFVETARLARQIALNDPEAAVSQDLVARVRAMGEASVRPNSETRGVPNVVQLRPSYSATWQPMALAASLALVVGVGAGLFMGNSPSGQENPVLSAAVIEQLEIIPSGREVALADGRGLTVVSSFEDAAGRFCREYETVSPEAGGYVAVACRGSSAWDLRFAMATGEESQDYSPASSLDALDAFFVAAGAGEPMSLEAEVAYLR